MNTAISIFAYTLAVTAASLVFAQPSGNRLVTPSLLTDTPSVEPGKPFRVGIALAVEPGYHIYWKNPGESGQPPEVKWNLPQGYTAGELQWPAPKKFMVPGAIFNFGYEDTITLLTTITPSPDAASGDLTSAGISAEVSWLVCNDDACLPGEKSVALTVPDSESAKTNAKLLDEAQASIPVASNASADVLRVHDAAASDTKQLKVEWKTAPSRIEFFPLDENVKIKQMSVSTNKMSDPPVSTIELFAAPVKGQPAEAIAGVLSYQTAEGQRRGVEVTVPANPASD